MKKLTQGENTRLLLMMKAIGQPMRLSILQFLVANPNCYTRDMVDALPISQATVSQHVKQLREAGWLASEQDCQMTTHWLHDENIRWFKKSVNRMF